MSKNELVDAWVEILAVLAAKGEIPELSDLEARRKAWELAQSEEQLAHMQALAAPERPRLDPDVIKRMIQEAEGIRSAEVAVPETEEDLREAIQAFGRANAASAIIEALTPLYEQAKAKRT